MPEIQFNRDEMARRYANRHLKTDPGIRAVFYLPTDAPEREIRLIEVNDLIADRDKDPLEPIDFGVDIGGREGHTLMVLDVTPAQWERIKKGELELPKSWSLKDPVFVPR
ncbi:MAG: hypothetical protein ACYC3I_09445 [Gemmataceae bacterium]